MQTFTRCHIIILQIKNLLRDGKGYKMKLIVNTDIKWGIGKNNALLFANKTDMKFFRETTTGGVVVMGRKTLESFPNGKPLKNRVNIVMTRSADYKNDSVTLCRSRGELSDVLAEYDADRVYLIGGASMYNELMDCCSEAYVTRTYADGNADCFINPLDGRSGWSISSESEMMTDGGTKFQFVTYRNDNVKKL